MSAKWTGWLIQANIWNSRAPSYSSIFFLDFFFFFFFFFFLGDAFARPSWIRWDSHSNKNFLRSQRLEMGYCGSLWLFLENVPETDLILSERLDFLDVIFSVLIRFVMRSVIHAFRCQDASFSFWGHLQALSGERCVVKNSGHDRHVL